ncbi:hypothetical protein [Thermoflavimicrobium daqui]|uniref:Uncharacterized protein n=1 Tax=Thermoflavimicrobium daqui TaxID=2137476 RepID=A0A364K0H1_9BACL|nr:hypothetical protein [Thermoflavimicrobium daqui]RAL20843.1 hypothetical protein DL897_17570 [Thermoflavimicrobium daqui]
MRIRLAVTSLFVTLLILFGAFYAYQAFYIENSIKHAVLQTSHISIEKLDVNKQEVHLELKADNQFSFEKNYTSLYQQIKTLSGNRKVIMDFVDQPSPEI